MFKISFVGIIITSKPVSSKISLFNASIGSSFFSICPPGGNHSLTFSCQCNKIEFFLTMNAVTVICFFIFFSPRLFIRTIKICLLYLVIRYCFGTDKNFQ